MSTHDDEFPLLAITASAMATSSFGPAGTVLADTVLAHSITSSGLIEVYATSGADGSINLCESREAAAMRHIEELRTGYGHSVEILCDDEEAMTLNQQMAVECLGNWTDWKRTRFYGEDVPQCLAKAVAAKIEWEQQPAEAPRPEPRQLVIEIASVEERMLDELAEQGILGSSADDVATYLIIRGLDDLVRAGVLKLKVDA